ncbi:MAG TPA: protease complex subunit PrcB family protein [Longimicrobium sp.]|nr:protease complex subunit PrcB family protein [Longimicrobium sp.]
MSRVPMHHLALAGIAALLAGAACSAPTGSSAPIDGEKSSASNVLPITRLRAEPYPLTTNSGIFDSVRVVISDPAHWQQTWSDIWNRHSPEPPAPQIDFTREMLVVAALGGRNSGGYGILVDSAYQRSDHVEVVLRKESPGARCATTAALTQPVDVARIPVTGQAVRFRERSLVHNCS